MILVSIITVVKNHAKGLESTVNSVLNQDLYDWELLIVVGSSYDETEKIAKNFAQRFPNVKFIKQKGNGIYEAMNQGLLVARGRYLWFMNAGDIFENTMSLSDGISKTLELNSDLSIGGHSVQGMEKHRTYVNSEKRLRKFQLAFTRRGSCHQSMIYKSDTLRKIGGFDTEFLICADFDSALKMIDYGEVYRLNIVLSRIEPGGGADRNINFVILERQRVRKAHLNVFLRVFVGLPWTCLAQTKAQIKKLSQNHLTPTLK